MGVGGGVVGVVMEGVVGVEGGGAIGGEIGVCGWLGLSWPFHWRVSSAVFI